MPRPSAFLSAGLLILAAAGLHTARPLSWGGAVGREGTRYKVSPLGLSHVLQPGQPISPTRDCRWSPPSGDQALCAPAPGGRAAWRGLRLVAPLLEAAALLSLGAALAVFSLPTRGGLRPLLPAAAAVTALGAVALFAVAAPRALAVLQGLDFGVGGTRGTLQVALASTLLAGRAAASLFRPRFRQEPMRARVRLTTGVILLLLPWAAFLLLFPWPGGLAFALAGSGLGLGTGWWTTAAGGRS